MSCLSTIDNLKLIFNQSTIQIVSAILSTIAACTSVFFAVKLQKFQKRLITNKLAIDDINELITKLSVARAIHDCPLLYQDSEFEKGIDLSEIP